MLTISKPLNAGQAQTYHSKEFTSPDQNYWQQGDVNLGEWQGKLAETFGLSGYIDAGQFARLSEGRHPVTGEQLVKHRTSKEYITADGTTVKPVEHRAGWDATFSAPKSVSLTALVGGDDRVREAHRAAVTVALDELQHYTQARIGGNNAAETTGKFIVAKFEHDTARPVDGYAAPQLHTHAVVFNMTQRDNGDTRALQERGMFDTQQFATAIYQSELTFRLRNLGYEIEAGRSGAPEIKGYTHAYLEASSPRSQQIREYLESTGFQGPAAAQIAAHDTRDKKEIHSTAEVIAAHYKVAAAHGHQAESVIAEARDRQRFQPLERVPDAPGRAKEAVSYAKSRGFEREAVSDERLLMRDALRRGMGDITYPEIRRNFDQRLSTGEFRSVDATKHATGRSFTTPETIAMERSAVNSLRLGQDAVEPIMQIEAARKQATSKPQLNEGQRKAIEEILTSRDRVHGLQGLAGTGKTTSLAVIREGAERNGYAVEGFAPTSKAAGQLRESGISADTLQGFLARGGGEQHTGDSASRHLYMLDESSLASTRQMRDFLEKIGPQDRVLVIGDTRQHQGVEAGKPFEQMQDAGMRTTLLDKIVRQREPELLAAVERLSQNDTAAGVLMLQRQGRVTQVEDRQERIAVIAKEYARQPENTIIVSPDNISRRDLNAAVRSELQEAGIVERTSHFLPTLIPRSELTGADRQWAAQYRPGDVIHYNAGSKELNLPRGSYAAVTSVDPDANRITVRREDGTETAYDPKRLKGVSTYQEIGREFSQGDRIQFTAPSKVLGVANRELATIERITDGVVTTRMDGANPRSVTFDSAVMKHFDHGYAVTSQSSQGITAERVLVNMDTRAHPELINTRFAYVAVSRASHDAQIYTNDAENLAQRLSHDVTKSSAVDFRQPTYQITPQKEPTLNQAAEHSQPERIHTPAEHDRHYTPLNRELHPDDAKHFGWKAEAGTVQSYQHSETRRHIHIDGPSGQFYDQQKNPISKIEALDRATGSGNHHAKEPAQIQEAAQLRRMDNNIGISL
ncbi:MobF family relaxase [Granulicella tundricola]|uniref:Conjugative relaxase domain protein n=1 Tax=Granulicella tundricola (strain ATCC BAA-1859 / DSM 23138 / MP5ACTX9) TaxID=1198114 RepID=E8X7G9_GRATM|nr:MobF family relaxase [Granulicella tundricola]ADW71403.1 conjugative relaxase domain protein [Granulicella tundricola MP5ACTX9]